MGYRIPFLQVLPLPREPIPKASYSPSSMKGIALEEVTLSLVEKGAVELAPLPSPGFYSRMFVVWKTSGLWRPVIDLSLLNRFIVKTPFIMETIQLVLLSVRQGDWMVSIVLKEAYLQVPVHPDSRKYLQFVAFSKPYQFQALLQPLHGSPGLHQGYGSDLDHSPQSRHSSSLISRRLAYSGRLSRGSTPGSRYCFLSLVGVLNCSEPGEVQLSPSSEGSISGYGSRCPDFHGFSVPGAHRQASVSRRRISVLQAAAHVHLAGSSGDSLLSLPSSSRGSPPHESSSTRSPLLVGSPGRCLPSLLVGRLSPGSLVDEPRLSSSQGVSVSALPRPRLMVRRVRRGLGCSPLSRGRFGPLVSR